MYVIGIYKITNKVNGKCYIGQAVDIERRWRKHKSAYKNPQSPNYDYPLYRAMRKYGIENFTFETLEECEAKDLNDKEVFYIAKFNCYEDGYNQTKGGDTHDHFLKLSQDDVVEIIHRLKTTTDTPAIIAEDFCVGATTIHYINIGECYKQDNETYPIRPPLHALKKLDDGGYELKDATKHCCVCGKAIDKNATYCTICWSIASRKVERPKPIELARLIKEYGFEEVGRQLGVSGRVVSHWCKKYDIPHTKDAIVRWYNEKMGIVPDPKPIKKTIDQIVRPIHQICKITGEILNTFRSQKEALQYLGVGNKNNHISQVCRGMRQSAYGYFWQYADQDVA